MFKLNLRLFWTIYYLVIFNKKVVSIAMYLKNAIVYIYNDFIVYMVASCKSQINCINNNRFSYVRLRIMFYVSYSNVLS